MFNYVYIYNRQVENNKLELTDYLSERCDYSEIKINGHWDFDLGEKEVEDRRYFECTYSDFETIRKSIDKNNNR